MGGLPTQTCYSPDPFPNFDIFMRCLSSPAHTGGFENEICLGDGCDFVQDYHHHLDNAGRILGPPPEVEYVRDGSCADDRRTLGACCFETVETRSDGELWQTPNDPAMVKRTECFQTTKSECESGILRRHTCRDFHYIDSTGQPGVKPLCCYVAQTFHEFFGRIRIMITEPTEEPPRAFAISGHRIRPTRYLGDHVMCKCSFNIEPFISDHARSFGFSECIKLPGDPQAWDEECNIGGGDGFQCQTIGFPLAIDEDGFAVFDAGLRRTDPGANACVYTLGDLYVDSGGVSHSISCVTTTTGEARTEVAIGDLHHSECVAMYQDYRWDNAFEC